MCVCVHACVCMHACVRAYMCVCVSVCMSGHGDVNRIEIKQIPHEAHSAKCATLSRMDG